MPHPFETFTPQRDPATVLDAIRDRARRRTRHRSAAFSAAGLVLLALAGVLLRPDRPTAPPVPLPKPNPVVTRAWSGGADASVVLFDLGPGRSVVFIQSNKEAIP